MLYFSMAVFTGWHLISGTRMMFSFVVLILKQSSLLVFSFLPEIGIRAFFMMHINYAYCGYLCFCCIDIYGYAFSSNLWHNIWSMKSYGDSKSWLLKYYFHSPNSSYNPATDDAVTFDTVYNVNVSNGGLVFCINDQLFIYSEIVRAYGVLPYRQLFKLPTFHVYTPSFFSLKTFGIRNVQLLN